MRRLCLHPHIMKGSLSCIHRDLREGIRETDKNWNEESKNVFFNLIESNALPHCLYFFLGGGSVFLMREVFASAPNNHKILEQCEFDKNPKGGRWVFQEGSC